MIYCWMRLNKYLFKVIVFQTLLDLGLITDKIFPNGKVQIAGLASIMSCAYIIRKIFKKLFDFFIIKDNYDITNISNVKIAMINSDFKLKNQINIVEFCKILSNLTINSDDLMISNNNKGTFLNIVYQPIKYPAINSKYICSSNIQNYYDHCYNYGSKKKFKSVISVLIFRSGSIIITGGNNLENYKETYLHLLEIVKNNILKLKI